MKQLKDGSLSYWLHHCKGRKKFYIFYYSCIYAKDFGLEGLNMALLNSHTWAALIGNILQITKTIIIATQSIYQDLPGSVCRIQ